MKLNVPVVALEPKTGALEDIADSGAVFSPLLAAGEVIGEAPKTIPWDWKEFRFLELHE